MNTFDIGRQVFPLPTTFSSSVRHQREAHQVIPGGAHTYAKGDDQFPENLAPVIVRGQGANVWDLDGNRFVEFGMGLRSVTLGHGFRSVCDAAYRAMLGGTNYTRPAHIELEAAEAMLSLVPGAEMIKFAKNGSDATTAALRLARAATGRELVALCIDHPFFSMDDWFITTTPMDSGVSASSRKETLTFSFNDIDSLKKLFEQHPKQIAAVFLEAERDVAPAPGFLEAVRDLCTREGTVLVFDEIVAGMRLNAGGGQTLHDVEPDLSTWGKAMANGFALAALMGKRELMKLGGLEETNRDRVFLLSTTNGAETHSLAAGIETIRTYREKDVIGQMAKIGSELRDGFNQITNSMGIGNRLYAIGHPANLVFVTEDSNGSRSQPMRTLFLQELIKRGVLAPNLVVSAAHTDKDIEHTLWAVAESAEIYKKALEEGVEKYLVGRSVKPVFRKRA